MWPMSKRKPPQTDKKREVSLVRSSAAEYLTFVAATGGGGVEAVYADESIWLTQKMLAQLYDRAESEFEKYRIVQDRLFASDFDRMLKQIDSGSAAAGGEE